MPNTQSTTPALQGYPVLSTDALRELIRDWDGSRSSADLISTIEKACSTPASPNTQAAKSANKRRGKSMSRRKGQNGTIEKHGRNYTLRVWMDVEGQEERAHVRIKICPISQKSPGWLNASERQNEAKRIIEKIRANSPERFNEVVLQTHPGERTFREQSAIYLQNLRTRAEAREKAGVGSVGQSPAASSRRPGSASTFETEEACLNAWLLPMLGDLPLSKVNNGALKRLVSWMVVGGPMPSNGKKEG